MKTYQFTISSTGHFLDGTNVSNRSACIATAERKIRSVIARGKMKPFVFKLTPR